MGEEKRKKKRKSAAESEAKLTEEEPAQPTNTLDVAAGGGEVKRKKKQKKKSSESDVAENHGGVNDSGDKEVKRKKKKKKKSAESEASIDLNDDVPSHSVDRTDDVVGKEMKRKKKKSKRVDSEVGLETNDYEPSQSVGVPIVVSDNDTPEIYPQIEEKNETDKKEEGGEKEERGEKGEGAEKGEGEGDGPAPEAEGSKRKRKRKRKKKGAQVGEALPDESAPLSNTSGSEIISNILNRSTGKADTDADKIAEAVSARLASSTTVYIEGLPFGASEEEVRSFFEENGCPDVAELRLPKWQDTGRLRGHGHVVFRTEDSRKRALEEVSGKHMGGRYVTVAEPRAPAAATRAAPRAQPGGCRVVFVKNLPYDATEDSVREALRVCGKITEGGVRLARNSHTNTPKGFGYVEFKNPEGAEAAVSRAAKPFGLTVGGRPAFVDYEEGTMKGSFRTNEGKLWSRDHGKKDERNKKW
mmetsp:Transcript_12577/g.25122  ORF Transcript_12577/g.25122 Transcript_12577/m.25122 type:complete len:471 (+) Transcript_12577:34-1446(+)